MSGQVITKKDISIVIQGPIEEGTDETLNSFEGFSDIVLSTWEDEDLSLLKDVKVDYKLVTSRYEDCGDTFLERFKRILANHIVTGCIRPATMELLMLKINFL